MDGWLGVSNSGRRSAGNRHRPPAFPGFRESLAARRSLSFFSLLAELPFCPYGSPRSRSVSFCPPSTLELTWLLSLYGTAPWDVCVWGGFGLYISLCPISLLCTRSTPQFGARLRLCPKSEPSRTPSPPRRPPPRSPGRREEPHLGPLVLPGSGLLDCPGLARRAAGRGRSVAGLPLPPKTYRHFFAPSFHLRPISGWNQLSSLNVS